MPPDAPTSAPAMISAQLPMTKPAIATAVPVKAFSSEMTTGMSAPPIGSTIITPNASAASTTISSTGQAGGREQEMPPCRPRRRPAAALTSRAAREGERLAR